MSVNLAKGQVVNLSKETTGLSKIRVALGWDEATATTKVTEKRGFLGRIKQIVEQVQPLQEIDCDASAALLTNGKLATPNNSLVYYGKTAVQGVNHSGDNLTGAGKGDIETILVDLNQVEKSVNKIDFFVNIYQAKSRNQHFGMVQNAFIRIVDDSTGKELTRYNLSNDFDGYFVVSAGLLERSGQEWQFKAIGEGTKDASIEEYVRKYR